MGVFRTSNVNAHTTSNLGFGYHVPFAADASFSSGNNMQSLNAIDFLSWDNYFAFDPWGYLWWGVKDSDPAVTFTGIGGWSLDLFVAGQRPRYP
jgi:hypothetical protein